MCTTDPICRELESDNSASFYFTQGSNECKPPPGFLDYFGPPPHYRFIDYDGIERNDVLERVRDFPEGEVAEDVLRELMPKGTEDVRESVRIALDKIYKTMDEHGPFDGICAYSEGATVGATLILDERRRFEEEGRKRQIKCAVFFAGWPPLYVLGYIFFCSSQLHIDFLCLETRMVPFPEAFLIKQLLTAPSPRHMELNDMVLADTCDDFVDVPTCHVVGATDPYLKGAIALYNVCDEDTAVLFDHGKGHTIPRDTKTIKELTDTIRGLTG